MATNALDPRRARPAAVLLTGVLAVLPGAARDAAAQDAPSGESPFRLAGSFSAGTTLDYATGAAPADPAASWLVSGTLAASLYGVELPFSFAFRQGERSFGQPFDRFGVSPRYRWARAHLGHRSMRLSEFTLAGAQFLGAGLELEPGPVRLAAMHGRFRSAVEPDSAAAAAGVQPVYRRTGEAVRLGAGTDRNHVDAVLFRARDDSASLASPADAAVAPPAENAAAAVVLRLSPHRAVRFEGEYALSAYTRDLTADPLPEGEDATLDALRGILEPRHSTRVGAAVRAAANLTLPRVRLRAEYRRVEPGYASMGAYYFTTDVENYTIAPTAELLGRRVRVGGSLGRQRDNLADDRRTTTWRTISSADVSLSPVPAFGLDARIANYGTERRPTPGYVPLTPGDSLRLETVSRSWSLSPRLTLVGGERTHTAYVSAASQTFDASGPTMSVSRALTLSGMYSLSLTRRGLSVSATASRTRSEAGAAETGMSMGALTVAGSALERRLAWNGSVGYTVVTPEGADALGTPTFGLGGAWQLTRADAITAEVRFDRGPAVAGTAASSTWRFQLGYSRQFVYRPDGR